MAFRGLNPDMNNALDYIKKKFDKQNLLGKDIFKAVENSQPEILNKITSSKEASSIKKEASSIKEDLEKYLNDSKSQKVEAPKMTKKNLSQGKRL